MMIQKSLEIDDSLIFEKDTFLGVCIMLCQNEEGIL